MLTGQRLFEGETVTQTLAEVLRGPIDFDLLPRDTPAEIRRLLRRCLDRNVKNRLRDIGEARIAIEAALAGETLVEGAPNPDDARRMWLAWSVAAVWSGNWIIEKSNLRFATAFDGFELGTQRGGQAKIVRGGFGPRENPPSVLTATSTRSSPSSTRRRATYRETVTSASVAPCSVTSRCHTRRAVCRCLRGTPRSASSQPSITGAYRSIAGRGRGRYSLRGGGTAQASACRTVRRCTPCFSASSRIDNPVRRSRLICSNSSTLDRAIP